METFVYLGKSAAIFSLFYLIYHLFYKNSTFFQVNRAYLLAIVPLSLILPLVQWGNFVQPVFNVDLPGISIGENNANSGIGFSTVTLWIYAAVSSVIAIRLIYNLIRLNVRIYKLKRGAELSMQPFSFFNFIHIPKNIEHNNLNSILNHEMVHVSQVHSLDIILYELYKIIMWWNPFVWIASYSVKCNHEFIADQIASKESKENYSSVLIAQLLGVNCSMLANNFNYKPLIKRRIMMMKTKKTKTLSILNYALVIPVVAVFTTVSINQKVLAEPIEPLPIHQEKVHEQVEVQPEFKGGMDGLIKYMTDNIKYPKETGLTGNVYVSFIVDEKGKITNAEVVKGAGEALDKEALRVVKAMPNWNPGKDKGKNVKVKMTLPISFKMD
jgi:TonB family protein